MVTRYFALIFGIVYVAVGVLGFVPPLNPLPADHPKMVVDAAYGYELGLFPVNVLHSIVHILIGVAGIVAYRSFSTARGYARGLAVLYAVLGVAGFLPGLKDFFGLIPLFGLDPLLHLASALVAAYIGFLYTDTDRDAVTGGNAAARRI